MTTAATASPSLNQLMAELTSHPRQQLQTFFRQNHYVCKHFVKALEGLLYAACAGCSRRKTSRRRLA
ncbi:hypothetical protein [Nitrospira sp. Nam80]